MKTGRFEIKSAQEMEAFGAKFARELMDEKRDGQAVMVQLVGDLGAGKTTFTRGIARGLAIDQVVTSPTFQVHKEYVGEDGKYELHHFDFYRLQDLGVMKNELQELMQDEKNIIIVEWGGILGELAKTAKIVKIEKLTDEKRVLLLE
jgi:tRNA threonylcarbamoyladenosine biosynthesis protein TsaE